MSDLRDLYQELILDHGRSPRNFRRAERSSHHAKGYNPLCGDQIELWVDVAPDGVVKDACFQGNGCAISQSSSSLLTQLVKGKDVAAARELFDRFHRLITAEAEPTAEEVESLGKLAVFAGVRDYPNRAKCATLAWHTLVAALDRTQDPVSTE